MRRLHGNELQHLTGRAPLHRKDALARSTETSRRHPGKLYGGAWCSLGENDGISSGSLVICITVSPSTSSCVSAHAPSVRILGIERIATHCFLWAISFLAQGMIHESRLQCYNWCLRGFEACRGVWFMVKLTALAMTRAIRKAFGALGGKWTRNSESMVSLSG